MRQQLHYNYYQCTKKHTQSTVKQPSFSSFPFHECERRVKLEAPDGVEKKKKRRQKQERKEVGLPFRHLKLDCDSGATWKQVPRSSLLLHSCFFGLFWISLVCLLLLLTFLLLLLLFTHFWHSPSDRLTDCYEGLQFCICCYCCSYYYYHHSCCCVYCCFSVSVYKHGKHIFRYLSRYYM